LRHGDVVTSLAPSFANDHLENRRGVFADSRLRENLFLNQILKLAWRKH
jgi:hypothetical protein